MEMALHNYEAESMETAFRRRTPSRNSDSKDLFASEVQVGELPKEETANYTVEIRAVGAIALAISLLELGINSVALRIGSEGPGAKASASFMVFLWSLVLVNSILLLLRSFDSEWVKQLRRKSQRGQSRVNLRGFDVRDPVFWSLASGAFLPLAVLAPGYHHQPVFYAASVCAVMGSLALLGLIAGKVRVEAQGLRTGNILSSFDRFIPFTSIRSIELEKKTLTIVSSNGHMGSTRVRRVRVLGGEEGLRSALVELVPEGTKLKV